MRVAVNENRRIFRELVLGRHGGACCVPDCDAVAVDAHHIIERRLFSDGGYHEDNGAAVCEHHHLEAESTRLTCDQLREWSNITRVHLPEGWDPAGVYDKWGNEILPDGRRVPGPLADDLSVHKVLDRNVVWADRIKYPRTSHLPHSPGATDDDVTGSGFPPGTLVVVTEKMDGENTTIYPDGAVHARSVDGVSHPWQTWVRSFAARVGPELPARWRVCGENLYAEHSIRYENLASYFYGFAVFNDENWCLDWDTTVEWFELLEVHPVPVIYRGGYDPDMIHQAWETHSHGRESEGYVVRTVDGFHHRDHGTHVGKWVRAGHVQTDQHWTTGPVILNELAR